MEEFTKEKRFYDNAIKITPREMGADIDTLIIKKLNNKFKGKCYKNALVLGEFEIIRRSLCTMITSELGGSGYINVSFAASVMTIAEGEHFVGTVVVKKQRTNIVVGDSFVASFKYDIPVSKPFVLTASKLIRYVPFRSCINLINPAVFQYPKSIIFNVSDDDTDVQEKLSSLINEIVSLVKNLPKDWKKYDEVLKKTNKPKPKGKKLKMFETGNITRYDLLDDYVYESDEEGIPETSIRAYQHFLVDKKNYLVLLYRYAKYVKTKRN